MAVSASLTELRFAARALDLNTLGLKYQTPEALRPQLRSLSALRYKPAIFAFHLALSAEASDGTVQIIVTAGDVELVDSIVPLSGIEETGLQVPVDLSSVQGQSGIHVQLQVTTVTGTAITADFDAVLWIEQPITVTSSCA